MDYRGHDLDLRTSRWSAASTDPTGWREVPTQAAPAHAAPAPRAASGRSGPIWVDDTLLACANQAYDVALAYRSPEVRLEHLLLAMTRVEAAAGALESHAVRVPSLRRDCAVAIAGDLPPPGSDAGPGAAPRRSLELEDVLRLAASRAAHGGRPGTVDDVVQVLGEIGGDLPGGDLIARHFPRPARDFWSTVNAPRVGQAAGAHLLEAGEGEHALSIVPPMAPAVDTALVQRILDRLSEIEHGFSDRLFNIERAFADRIANVERALSDRLGGVEAAVSNQPAPLLPPLPAPVHVDFVPLENRLAAIENTLQNRPVIEGHGVAAIDPAITDRLWAIEHALGVERTERASAITQLSDEISGVRSAVRLASQGNEQAQAAHAEHLQQLSAGLEQHRIDLASSLGDRIALIEQTLDSYDQKVTETQAVYSAELAEVHDALMKISANQHTLAGAIDNWRNNDGGEIHLINARIGAVHEDGAKRLAAIEKLCADVETLSQLVLEDRSQVKPRSSFAQWLYGTEDWVKASWRGNRSPSIEQRQPKPPRVPWRVRLFKRRSSSAL